MNSSSLKLNHHILIQSLGIQLSSALSLTDVSERLLMLDILRMVYIINWGTMRLTSFLGKVSLSMKGRYGFASRMPSFGALSGASGDWIKIVHTNDAKTHLPEHKVKDFLEKKSVTSVVLEGSGESAKEVSSSFYSESSWRKLKDISKDVSIDFSKEIRESSNFAGLASEILATSYKFSRKQKDEKNLQIRVGEIPDREYVLQLAKAKIQAAEWANSRGNEANTAYLLTQAQRIASQYPQAKIKVIRGKELLDDGFGLHHAVGRASENEPMLVCLEWTGAVEPQDYVALVGKGLCFDSGGLNLKPTSGISGMHIDKHGACSVLSAFESVARLNMKSNVVAVLGLAENFVSSNSYRPLDIIKSRKGLTVEIGNTDAEGRLVLADCMNWVQTNYRVKTLVELSTLTGAIIVALGKQRAGVFTNSQELANELGEVGKQIEEWTWHLPVDEYHEELVKPKTADLTNSSGKPDGSSCQAAAFLKHFVEPGVQWAHIDIAGAAGMDNATGYGAKLLIHFLKNRVK